MSKRPGSLITGSGVDARSTDVPVPAPDIEARLVELETRMAFQERLLGELGDALSATRMEADRLRHQLQQALEHLQRPADILFPDSVDEPPPPHY